MRRILMRTSLTVSLLLLAPVWFAQGPSSDMPPTISARQFTSGTAKVTVTGSFQIDAEIEVNTKASFGDGEMTWLQFGDSGAPTPNATITYSEVETGIIVAKGKLIATARGEQCKGTVEVTAGEVIGEYTCAGIDCYDPGTGKMGKVNITIRYTAKS